MISNKRNAIYISCLATCLLSFVTVAAEPNLLMLLVSNVGGDEYVLSVHEVNLPHSDHEQVFEVQCRTCTKSLLVEEKTLDYPIAIYRAGDDSPLFFTLWTTGSAYRIKVFNIASGDVKKVLDTGSDSIPKIVQDKDGRWAVMVTNRFQSQQYRSVSIQKGLEFSWDGTAFERIPN